MTVVYAVSEHPRLSGKATALLAKSEDAFDDEVALAAELLGVDGTTYTGDQLVKINRAVVIQLNYQLELMPNFDAFLYKAAASSHSKQAVTYRGDNSPPVLSVFAVRIVQGVEDGSGWGNIKAVR